MAWRSSRRSTSVPGRATPPPGAVVGGHGLVVEEHAPTVPSAADEATTTAPGAPVPSRCGSSAAVTGSAWRARSPPDEPSRHGGRLAQARASRAGRALRSLVTSELFRLLPPAGLATLRFNFRGVEGFEAPPRPRFTANAWTSRPWRAITASGWSFGADVALTVSDTRVAGWALLAPPLRVVEPSAMVAASDPQPKSSLIVNPPEPASAGWPPRSWWWPAPTTSSPASQPQAADLVIDFVDSLLPSRPFRSCLALSRGPPACASQPRAERARETSPDLCGRGATKAPTAREAPLDRRHPDGRSRPPRSLSDQRADQVDRRGRWTDDTQYAAERLANRGR